MALTTEQEAKIALLLEAFDGAKSIGDMDMADPDTISGALIEVVQNGVSKKTSISEFFTGSPAGVKASLTALQTDFPEGATGVYVASDNGHWYYWSGSAWIDGGLYQSPLAVVQTTGTSETDVMSQKAVTDEIAQLAGEVNELELKDAVQGAKIKDIENVLSTANIGQSAKISVTGTSPLSLPKNAANSGMSVKMEGLTQDVGGVTTHFEPTGRVRSVGKNKVPLYPYGFKYHSDVYDRCTIYLKANTTYILSAEINGTSVLYELSSNIFKTFSNVTGRKSLSFTTGSSGIANIMYLKLGKAAVGITSTTTPEKMQVEESILTAYEPYRETSLYLTAPELRSNGTVKDEIRKGANGYELVKRISDIDGTVLATPVISPINYGGILNSAENGTVYHEPVIADAGVYGTNLPILMTDYPIATIEEIIKHEEGVDTYLNASTAVIAPDGLSFTHPSLANGDLVLFTYSFAKESTNGNITATFYDSNVVKIDTATGTAYKIEDVVTNGVLTRTLTEV